MSRPQVFIIKNPPGSWPGHSTFWSLKSDLSDLADEYLVAAIDCLRRKGIEPPPEAIARLSPQKR